MWPQGGMGREGDMSDIECWGREKSVLVWEIICAAILQLPNPYCSTGPQRQERCAVANHCWAAIKTSSKSSIQTLIVLL